jgi:hypothetical protein
MLVGLLFLAGCTQTEDYLEVFRDQHKAVQEVTAILAKIRNEQDMAAARDELDERFVRFEKIARRARALPSPPPADVVSRVDKEGIERSIAEMRREIDRVKGLPGGEQFFSQFEDRAP